MIIDRPMSAEWPAILDGFGFLVSLAARALGYPLVLASVLLFRRQGPGLRGGGGQSLLGWAAFYPPRNEDVIFFHSWFHFARVFPSLWR